MGNMNGVTATTVIQKSTGSTLKNYTFIFPSYDSSKKQPYCWVCKWRRSSNESFINNTCSVNIKKDTGASTKALSMSDVIIISTTLTNALYFYVP